MELTRSKAIELTKELWKWLAETGNLKEEWTDWGRYGEVQAYCFLCEYSEKRGIRCSPCPLVKMFPPETEEDSAGCYNEKCYYERWELAGTKENRKKYAALFLKQLEELR